MVFKKKKKKIRDNWHLYHPVWFCSLIWRRSCSSGWQQLKKLSLLSRKRSMRWSRTCSKRRRSWRPYLFSRLRSVVLYVWALEIYNLALNPTIRRPQHNRIASTFNGSHHVFVFSVLSAGRDLLLRLPRRKSSEGETPRRKGASGCSAGVREEAEHPAARRDGLNGQVCIQREDWPGHDLSFFRLNVLISILLVEKNSSWFNKGLKFKSRVCSSTNLRIKGFAV